MNRPRSIAQNEMRTVFRYVMFQELFCTGRVTLLGFVKRIGRNAGQVLQKCKHRAHSRREGHQTSRVYPHTDILSIRRKGDARERTHTPCGDWYGTKTMIVFTAHHSIPRETRGMGSCSNVHFHSFCGQDLHLLQQ